MNRKTVLTLAAAIVIFLAGILLSRFVSQQTRAASPPAVDPKQVVDSMYPPEMAQAATERENRGGSAFSRKFCFVVYESLADGNPGTIIAAYTDGIGGTIRVIRGQGDGKYGVVFEPTEFSFGGGPCEMGLVDLDADGRKEIMVSFANYRIFTADWYFRWDGVQLINLGPTHGTAPLFTAFNTTGHLDLDHDGTLEIMSPADASLQRDEEGFIPNAPIHVYKLSGGVYIFDRTLVDYGFFVRETGKPRTEEIAVNLTEAPTGSYVLKVINGKAGGSRRVSSARIVLNGVEILSPNNFSQQVEFLTIPVTLVRHNIIEVTLAGTPLGEIIFTIEDTSAQPQ